MNTRKFAFIASFLSVVGLLAGSAHAAVTIPSTIDTMLDLEGGSETVTGKKDDFFGNGGGIKNGTLDVTFAGSTWWSMVGKTFTVGQGGTLNVKPSAKGNASCQMNFQGGGTLTIDGGEVVNENNRGSQYGQYIGCDQTGKGEIRIVNGGTFTSKNLFVRIGLAGGATGILSIDDGTFNVANKGKNLLVACSDATGIVAVTNGTINAQDIELCESSSNVAQLRFVDSELNIMRIWANKNPASGSFCILDGCTINSGYKEMLSDIKIPYQLEGKGLIANPSVDSEMYGTYVSRVTDRGTGPIVKKGPKTVTFKGTFDGPADLRVEEGVFAIDPTASLPTADKIDLAISGTGAFEGLDQSVTYKSLTLGEGVAWKVTIDEDGTVSQPWTASSLTIDATAQSPILLTVSGTVGEDPIQLPNFKAADKDKILLLTAGLQLVEAEDGEGLAVQETPREVGVVNWNGAHEGLWWGKQNWLLGEAATTFLNGDTVVFNKEDAAVTLDKNAVVAGIYVTNNVAITGEKTLVAPIIDVTAEKTATIAVPLSEDIEKTGEGELVLQDYADGKALDLKGGKVSLVWSDVDAAHENPFSTANDANAIAGVLDLGGATQTVWVSQSASPDQTFLDGFKLLNGTLTADCEYWFHVNGGRTLTVGQGATLNLNRRSGADARGGELNIRQGSAIVVDGGTFNANNARSGSAQGNVVGNDWSDGVESNTSKLLVINGGEFNRPNNYLEVGVKQGVTGILAVTNGTVNLANGTKWLSVAPGRGDHAPTGVVSMQGGTLIAETIVLCDASAGNTAQLTFEGSNISAQRIYAKKTPSQDSFVIFDGVTWTVTGTREDILADPGCPITIGDGGLTIYTDHDVTISTPLAGEGGLVKKGSGKLTFSGAQSFEGGLEVCAGSIGSTLTANDFATQDLDLSLNLADGETVRLTIAGTPEPGVNYTLFKSGITEETLPRLKIDANYELSLEDGQLKVKLSPLSLTWTGEGENKLWSTVANWRNATREPTKFDTVIFDGESDETEYDLADGLLLKEIDVNSGAWTTKVDTACFAGVPVHVETGALFALTGAKVTNPFSTANDANAIAGVLDLGGATQAFTGALADGNGIFRDGGEIRNVALTVDPTGWFRLHNVSFTIGTNAAVTVKKYTDSKGQLNLYDSYLKIDGGSLTVLNERNIGTAGAYIGNNGDATIEILNGGSFSHPNKRVILGYGSDGKGAGSLIGEHATVDLGNKTLNLGNRNGSASCLALTNSTLTCSQITLGFEGTPGKQTVELVDTKVNLAQFNVAKLGSNSSVLFDGATIVDNHGATQLLADLGIPYTIAEGGLTVKVANKDDADDYVSFPGTFDGTGGITFVAAGKTPREARFTGVVAEEGFTGNLVVSNKITVVADGKTFKGGLYACEGSTLNVATSVFEGDVTIEEGVRFAEIDVEQDYDKPVVLLQAKGTITSPLLDYKDPNTKNRYFVRSRLGVNTLCYGRKPGMIITIR